METGCIYAIVNRINGKMYIGSTINFDRRKRKHLESLKSNVRDHHSNYLQNAFEKYGERSFKFIKLIKCDKDRLVEMEQKYLDRYEPWKPEKGYNVLKKANWSEVSEETKAKIGEKSTGERNGNSRLTKEEVREMKSDLKYGKLSYRKLAEEYGVTECMIRFIHIGKNWSNVEFEGDVIVDRVNYVGRRDDLTENEVKTIMRELMKGDKTQLEIANQFNIDESQICRINQRKSFDWVSIPEDNGGDKISTRRMKLTRSEAKRIKQEIAKYDEVKDEEIAEKLGYNKFTVRNIRKETTWEDIEVDGGLPGITQLNKKEVVEIKKKLRDNPNIDYKQIAKGYNRDRRTIGLIARGESYSDIEVKGFEPINKRLTEKEVIEIKEQLRDKPNKTYQEIADEYNTTKTTIGNISLGKTWSNVEVEGFEPGGRT